MKRYIIGIITFLATSCTNDKSSDFHNNYMAFENIKYIKEFPASYSLDNDQTVEWDVIGIKAFCCFDSLLVITSTEDPNGLWHFLTADKYQSLGNYITRGGGPTEFEGFPRSSDANFYKKNNQIFADIYDFGSGRFYRINVSNTIRDHKLDITLINSSLPAGLFDQVLIDSSTVYCKTIANEQRQQIRSLWKNGEETTPQNYKLLNQVSVTDGGDFNIISTITKKSPDNDIIVEAPIGLDQVNIFSAEDTFAMTICPNKKNLDNIHDIEDQIRWERIYTYGGVRTYPDFFAVLYINEDQKTFQTERKTFPTIQIFDWKGNPLMEIKLNRFITSFDFDFYNGYIYALDNKEDIMYKYEVKNILTKLPRSV